MNALLPLVETFEPLARLLTASLLYCALLDSILRRVQTKTYAMARATCTNSTCWPKPSTTGVTLSHTLSMSNNCGSSTAAKPVSGTVINHETDRLGHGHQ